MGCAASNAASGRTNPGLVIGRTPEGRVLVSHERPPEERTKILGPCYFRYYPAEKLQPIKGAAS